MILSTIDHQTGLPLVQETRALLVGDLIRRKCTCPMGDCRWYPLPRQPYGDLLHVLEDSPETAPWWPHYQTWQDGTPQSVTCWKCNRPIKGWRPKLTAMGQHHTVNGQPAVHLALYDHYRAKRFQAYLPALRETVQFDALHCADCTLDAADGDKVIAIYLAGLLDAHWTGLTLAKQLRLPSAHSPDTIASYLMRWSKAEPIGPIHRTESDTALPLWRS